RLPSARRPHATRGARATQPGTGRGERAGRTVSDGVAVLSAAPAGARGLRTGPVKKDRPGADVSGRRASHAGSRRLARPTASTLGAAARSIRHLRSIAEGEEEMSASKYKPDPKLDLVLERVVDVPPHLVWEAWTKPEHLKKWFCPRPWKTTDCEI